ncbi:hypothetical protein LC608_28570 [Nostoc sp. XA010]|uniref:hypothetical protein n=1 Tax=Nostoc sp. XA010 TaxID=2780407 RepID=UPI001E2D63B4|nr:hypothetical protein [Nostoc sp. XA010]MCC5660857.1 hypothetical protein [Nostoc sp. XA010]
MSFSFRFRPFVLQLLEFSPKEFNSLCDRFTLHSIQFNRRGFNRLDYCPSLIIRCIPGINNGVPILTELTDLDN